MSDRDFPKLPVPREVKFVPVEVTTLRDMIRKTFFSISADETRYHLNGVLLETEPSGETVRARMVSTDGHRLSKVERDVPGAPILGPGIIIPRKGLGEMRRGLESLSGTVEIGIHQGHFFMRAADNVLTVKLIEAQFPPYQQVIPREQSRIAVVNRLALLEALRRISIMSSDKTHGVKLSVEPGILRVQSDNPDLGQGREEIDIRYDGTVLSIGFNARYFIELLSEIESEEVKLEFGGELDPALVRPVDDDYLGVVMPMRI